MKLTTIIAAALPLAALAVPSPPPSADMSKGEFKADFAGKDGQFKGNGGEHSGQGREMGEHFHQRDLEVRDDVDHYIKECDETKENICKQQVVVPKGKSAGACLPRLQPKAETGHIDIIDRNVMCRYYMDANCKGHMSGPFSNAETGYNLQVYLLKQFIWNPQSYQCQLIGFQAPNLPAKMLPPIDIKNPI